MTVTGDLAAKQQQRRRQQDAAAERVRERTEERRRNERVLERPGGLADADSPDRVDKRIDRLSRFYGDRELLGPDDPARAIRLERIVGTADFVGVRYLDAGVAAARGVGRVNIRDGRGNLVGYGTGSLVSQTLLLTNHHVLPDAETARISMVEFNYQDGIDGKPLASRGFDLDPDRLFIADEERDFALVAVKAAPAELADFGFNRLIEAEGKVIIGEFVTIVQHPRGEKKQVVLRENRLVDVPDKFLHYVADTEPGSSGSPVFNDQWEVVALHHASVPADGEGGFVNEGIRVSRICRFLREAALPPDGRALVDAIFATERMTARLAGRTDAAMGPAAAVPGITGVAPPVVSVGTVPAPEAVPVVSGADGDGEVTISVPLEVTVRLGRIAQGTAEKAAAARDYTDRAGYDPGFLSHPLPMPALSPELAKVASAELRYHHFSIVMHRLRRLALFTACNIDGKLSERPRRENTRWITDPRLPRTEQTDDRAYEHPDLDRGHLVRRLDPVWGPVAEAANDDTFHFTNATPQHHAFNAGATLWLGLEDYVLKNADVHDLAVSVFTGPVLEPDDEQFSGVQLPRQFWKLVAMVKGSGELSVTGYLLSQAALLKDLVTEEAFSYGAYRTFQVPVRRVAELTGLGLSAHIAADPLARLEATALPREILRAEDLVL
ncbi:endonuclease G [Actinocorallia herbida]|uniref:Endonuclease G n=1 Tax=Actinocorallia herbida TaxID=58109 RepID=A0A3N1CXN2_9ACTN|nr:DNA/RNA non-specific endonuclease [Actinocorallia herbida]ROO86059.1 endonuclease G [Actinocorallia herbida]